MKCPKCSTASLLCKSPKYDICYTGRYHLARQEVELGKKIETVKGDQNNCIYFCEECGFSGSKSNVFELVILKGEQEDERLSDPPPLPV